MGFQYLFIKDLIEFSSNNIFIILSFRFFMAFVFLFFILIILKKEKTIFFKDKNIITLSFFHPISNFLFQTTGLIYLPTVIVGVLVALIPIVNGIVGKIFLKEVLTKRKWIGIFTSSFGAGFAAFCIGGVNKEENIYLGILLLLISIFSRSIYSVYSKKLSTRYDSYSLSYNQCFWGGVVFFFLFLLFGKKVDINFLFSISFLAPIFYLSFFATVLVFILNNYALSKVSVSSVGIMNNLTGIISILVGVFFLKEEIPLISLVGFFIVGGGIFLYYKSGDKP